MSLFNVYPLYNINLVKASDCTVIDSEGTEYLDFYGGHGVISIGHQHPLYVQMLTKQLHEISFYSNSVQMPLQKQLADKLLAISGYENFSAFFCNSGAEANENALKLASFHTGRNKLIAFKGSFHGRTSLALNVTDDSSIAAPVNSSERVKWAKINDIESVKQVLTPDVAAVIIEGIQGVGGVIEPEASFLEQLETLCNQNGSILILDEIQSGYGRTGKFFAHQYSHVTPHIITMAKGIGNGFPLASVLISPQIKATLGMLGTTFGGNHLACAAGLATATVFENEHLMKNAADCGNYIFSALKNNKAIKQLRGKGLMIGVEPFANAKTIRDALLYDFKIFTGFSGKQNTIRLLPPLTVTPQKADKFIEAFNTVTNN